MVWSYVRVARRSAGLLLAVSTRGVAHAAGDRQSSGLDSMLMSHDEMP
jgi:hypothetical protein